MHKILSLFVSFLLLASSIFAQSERELVALDASWGDQFGIDIDSSIGVTVVGAAGEGAAYLFDAITGVKLHKLVPSVYVNQFGWSVAISGDRVAVGSPNGNKAFVYDVNSGAELFILEPAAGDHFGIHLDADGTHLAITAPDPNFGAAYVYDFQSGLLVREFHPGPGTLSGDYGSSVSISSNLLVVGDPGLNSTVSPGGAAFAYDISTGALLHTLTPADGFPGDRFGSAVEVGAGLVAVGAVNHYWAGQRAGAAYLFDLASGVLVEKLGPDVAQHDANFGGSLSMNSTHLLVGAWGETVSGVRTGAVYLFDVDQIHKTQKIVASNLPIASNFGYSVCFDGTSFAIGNARSVHRGPGTAYQYTQIGEVYCSGWVPNTSGYEAKLRAEGSSVVADNDFRLVAIDLPVNEFGYFLISRMQGWVVNPGGSMGNLCLAGGIGRFNRAGEVVFSVEGSVSLQVPMTNLPEPPNFGVSVMPGETWNFQCWHRDWVPGVGSTSNFSEALEVTFD